MPYRFIDSIGPSVAYVQVGVNNVHNIWLNGSLEYSRQVTDDSLFRSVNHINGGDNAMAERRKSHAPLNLEAPTGRIK
jgi:hypothetical protein